MPAPRKLPSNEVLLKLREKGLSYAQIADEYGVTEGAVYWQLRDAGATKTRADHSKYLPWKVKIEHAHTRPATLLRYLSRHEHAENGRAEPLPAAKERMVTKWLADLETAGVVVCYDRDMPPNPASPKTGGFYYSRRTEKDGDNIIRCAPEERDHTSKVKKAPDQAPEPRNV
jgi:hypothetical protein